jgi:hypothetical protein
VAARRTAMHVAARAVERRLNADTSDYDGPTAPCPCGLPARYAGRQDKTFGSVLGPLKLSRAYYHCAACQRGFCPRDGVLGLQDGSLSPGVLRMVGRVGAPTRQWPAAGLPSHNPDVHPFPARRLTVPAICS